MSYLATPAGKVTSGLSDSKELFSPVKGRKGNILGSRVRVHLLRMERLLLQVRETLENRGFKVLSFSRVLSHAYIPINVLNLSDTI